MHHFDVKIKPNSCLSILKPLGILLFGTKEELAVHSVIFVQIYLSPFHMKGVNTQHVIPARGRLLFSLFRQH